MCEANIGMAIKKMREKKKMSQWDLHSKTGLKPNYISKLENEVIKSPSLPTIFKLAKAFQMKPSEFICMAESFDRESCECIPVINTKQQKASD